MGMGHKKAADVLEKELSKIDNIEILNINVLSIISSFIVKALPDLNLLYRTLYSFSIINTKMLRFTLRRKKSISYFNELFIDSAKSDVLEFIKQIKPDIIICTHAFPANIISNLIENRSIKNTKFFIVATDYVSHKTWPLKNVTEYFVPNKEYRDSLILQNVKDPITISGIPVSKKFYELYYHQKFKDNKEVLFIIGSNRYDLENLKITKKLDKFIKLFNKYKPDYSLNIVCGKSESLKKKYEKICQNNKKIKVYGLVENMSEVLEKCELVITKAGGITSTEIIAAGKILVFIAGLGIQELENIEYLENNKVAKYYDNIKDLYNDIPLLLSNENLKKVSTSCKIFQKTSTLKIIVNEILKK
ncbi:hypothetical protein A2X44_00355 [candidate division CPR3 bacterium GWF2_35_18]|nr:MAG: Monogalactosyldiacylglycerol synthase [candidate division CPR3 bacterium GW2011_GWE2_35_7]OGB63365.1 MAG: hypothetical protein A2X44_00355 [candidate division CPR3 bacterium GWF2_35_18]OGB80468.1 MAG: hypothetical protein A2011_00400 [candidate division CPR3 bacterium GWE2_35_7]